MKYFYLFLFFCASLFLPTSCNKDEAEVTPLSNVVKEYVFFLPNSKWVFQNDSTLARDTVTITSSSITQNCYYRDNDDFCWDDMKIEYFSSFMDTTFSDISGYQGSDDVIRSNVLGGVVFRASPPYPSQYSNLSKEFFNSMDVNGQIYSSVYKFHYDNKVNVGTNGYIAFDFYWAAKVGNIKKVIYKDSNVTSWSLIYKDVHQ